MPMAHLEIIEPIHAKSQLSTGDSVQFASFLCTLQFSYKSLWIPCAYP